MYLFVSNSQGIMEYTTIFSSHDRTEVTIIKHLFEEHKVDYNILGETTNDAAGIAGSGGTGMRVQVPADQVEKARSILLKNGYLGSQDKETIKIGNRKRRKKPVISRWILIFLAALVLIIVALLIMYFMNPDT